MPKVERKDIDNLNAVITVTLEKSDYEPKFNTELGKYRKQANMKGFRKGKTPVSVLRKMYGKGVLADVINEMLQSELYQYLNENGLNVLGQPLPSEEQEPVEFDLKALQDYVFKFDIGLSPDFEVKGADESETYEKMAVEVADDMVEEDLMAARKRSGNRESVTEMVKDNDMVKFAARELEGETVKESGISTEFSVLINNNTNEAVREALYTKKQGDTIRLNLLELEEGRDEDYVRKYYLNLEEADADVTFNPEFEAEILEVNRIVPAALDQEFFDQAFGEGEVASEEEAKEKIREQIAGFYNNQAEALLSRDIQERLLELNPLELPEAFLKRWMAASNEGVTAEQIEAEFDNFAKNLQWSLIRNKLVSKFEIKVEEGEVVEAARRRIRSYFGGAPMAGMEQIVESTAMRILQDEKQVEQLYEEVLTDRVFGALIEKVSIAEKPVDLKTFEAEVEKARASNASSAAAEEEE